MKLQHLVFIAYGVLVGYLSLRAGTAGTIEPFDKLGHFFVYLIFALLALRVVSSWKPYLLVLGALLIYSALLELGQSQIPGRDMSGLDLLANLAGLAVGGALGYWTQRQQSADGY